MRMNPLSHEQQQRAKTCLLAKIAKTGHYNAVDMLGLMVRDLDGVLDEAFRFTDSVRVRVDNDHVVIIYPRSKLQ